MLRITDDIKIENLRPLLPPAILLEEIPLTELASEVVTAGRDASKAIMAGEDDRLLVVVGPCSIHDVDAAMEYAQLLATAARQYQAELAIIMRVYFEKPRTTVGWKGLINDPKLDDSFDINHGLRTARKLLLDINNIGLAVGTEFLDTIIPQFIADLVAWGAIGARTTQSQIHRELASGLSMPIGFKNGTNGDVQIAVNAVQAVQQAHHFLSVTKHGLAAIVSTRGNDACHVILRGSKQGTNYDAASVQDCCALLHKAGQIKPRLMVDCSHGNSRKIHTNQPKVLKNLCQQIAAGSTEIGGVMIESHLKEGNQNYAPGATLEYGKSITDACVSWQTTESLLAELAQAVRERRQTK